MEGLSYTPSMSLVRYIAEPSSNSTETEVSSLSQDDILIKLPCVRSSCLNVN